GVTYPTSGEINVDGRVSALLELTAGFDPEFTGRENIYFRGQLFGMKDEEIRELEQEIVEFADLNDYIDQPVRTYSSGMKARLGFAINVSIKPEILIVDEALSVGDSEFKKRCLEKIKQILAEKDVTFLFVTHSTNVAKSFCDRGLVMRQGKLLFDSNIDEAIDFYKKTLDEDEAKKKKGKGIFEQ
ncbi:MAG: ABC transporter ATP-binding protein, partial [Firmicutes bacterium]|nr:ABC transporter ATP-binding protein [Bacillota bacterium]